MANGSITLLPGFTVSSGSTFHAFINSDNIGVPNLYSPNRNLNYILAHTVRKAGIQNPSDSTNLNSHVNTRITYVDAWGREAGKIRIKASTSNKDVMKFREYDDVGMETTQYLPYTKLSNGSLLPNIEELLDFYSNQSNVVHTPYPYAQTRFEESGLRRVREKGWPGDAWQLSTASSPNKGHTLRYNLNLHRREALYKVAIDANGNPSLIRTNNNALYPIDALERVAFQDENGTNNGSLAGSTLECKDRDGRIVVKRKYNNNGNTVDTLSTYYVYDDFGNLGFVLPPAANPDNDGAISQATLDNYCYQYIYDGRQRVKAKKLPGKGWEFIVYNRLDQAILTQDSLQRMKSPQQWTANKYDAQGRPVINAMFISNELTPGKNCLNDVQNNADTSLTFWESRSDTGIGYTILSYPSTNLTILAVHYFDNYNIPNLPNESAYNQFSNFTKMTRGLQTASMVKVDGISHYLWNVNYYDDESQVVRTIKQHYKGGSISTNNFDVTNNTYDYTGLVVEKIRRHYVSGVENLFVKNSFKYDAWGRIVDTYQTTSKSINTSQNIPVLLSRIEYNEIGQISRKRLHSTNSGSTFAQDILYSYNERGWLKNQESPLFNLTLNYESDVKDV
ncbi:MAG: hypothetical protein EOO43_04950 [Flavobacterium sp.]|nr:MAG: hypothetical protein EOO43_04950 [Flavobacterium sp.]